MEPSEPLYQKFKIDKLKNNIILKICLFVFDELTNNLPDIFDQFFQPVKKQHNHNTRGSQQYLLNIPKANTQVFGYNSIRTNSIKDWNKKNYFSSELLLLNLSNLLKIIGAAFADVCVCVCVSVCV